MNNEHILILFSDSIKITLIILFPLLLPILFTGFLVSLIQAVTQITEQTLSFIPKIITFILALIFFGPWILHTIIDYIKKLFTNIPFLILYLC